MREVTSRFYTLLLLLSLAAVLSPVSSFAKKPSAKSEVAYFAGGCFWCMEPPFEKLDGVSDAVSGYIGGQRKNPTYKEVSSGATGHTEAVKVIYDPSRLSFKDLLEVFWRNIDPTDKKGQFVDRGRQYRPGVFYRNAKEKKLAEESVRILTQAQIFKKPIVAEITSAGIFYQAEDYHQDYYKKNKVRYKYYRFRSGRDDFLKKTWKGKESFRIFSASKKVYVKPKEEVLRDKLTPLQYKVTQKDGTEPPFKNKYWDNKRPGIYVDIVSGEPLFSSLDKFKSGTGWPSFTKPLDASNIVEKEDRKLFRKRTEVRSMNADSHLGHVFKDGPEPTGLRYCINSAALRFISAEDLEKEGYPQYKALFS